MPLGWLLGPLAASWEALGASWKPLGRILAASWRSLGFSWQTPGALGELLGRSWGGLGVVLTGLGAVLERSWVILGHLGRAWSHLVAIWGRLGEPKTLIFLVFFNDFSKINISNKNRHLGRSWGLLGASWVDLGAPREPLGRQSGPGSSGSRIFRAPKNPRDPLAGSLP